MKLKTSDTVAIGDYLLLFLLENEIGDVGTVVIFVGSVFLVVFRFCSAAAEASRRPSIDTRTTAFDMVRGFNHFLDLDASVRSASRAHRNHVFFVVIFVLLRQGHDEASSWRRLQALLDHEREDQ